MSQPPRNRVPTRRVSTNPGRPAGARPPATNVNMPPRRDIFPVIMGGVIGAMVVGLIVVVFLISQNNGGTPVSNNPSGPPVAGATAGNDQSVPTTAADEPPRIPLADFKTEYDSANRPLIIDVRAKDAYDAGHIKGAISFPEADVDTRINELPKGKPIVAYCQ